MHRTLKVVVEGRPYTVVVEDVTDQVGTPVAAPAPTPAPVVAAPVVSPAAAVAAGGNEEVSPLSGIIDSVDVTVGSVVKAGDQILTIEAMKMRSGVSANTSGTVTSIAVRAGDAVEAGQVLLVIA
jgi:biotin carboxyl carrier protein